MNSSLRSFLRFPPFKLWLRTILSMTTLAYVGLMLFASGCANELVFHPHTHQRALPGEFKLHTADGNDIGTVFLPNPQAAYVLLYSYGNGEDMFADQDRLHLWQSHGWAVCAYDYPGYANSSGHPTEAGCDAAIDAAYDYLVKTRHIPTDRIVLYGKSLGNGPTIDLASRKPVGGLVLECAYTSIFRIVTHYRILPWDMFNSIAKIPSIHVPLLSIHDYNDVVVPFWHGKEIYDVYVGPKQHYWVPDAGHNNIIESNPSKYLQVLETYRKSLPATEAIK